MSIRTNSPKVEKVLKKNYDGTTDLNPFIETASVQVDQIVQYASDNGFTAVPAATLEIIERWLSAHYYGVMAQLYVTKRAEGTTATFQGQTAMYLESTVYGQMAMRLDPTGYLSSIGTKNLKIARAIWLGKDPIDQLDYEPGVGRSIESE